MLWLMTHKLLKHLVINKWNNYTVDQKLCDGNVFASIFIINVLFLKLHIIEKLFLNLYLRVAYESWGIEMYVLSECCTICFALRFTGTIYVVPEWPDAPLFAQCVCCVLSSFMLTGNGLWLTRLRFNLFHTLFVECHYFRIFFRCCHLTIDELYRLEKYTRQHIYEWEIC